MLHSNSIALVLVAYVLSSGGVEALLRRTSVPGNDTVGKFCSSLHI